MNYRKQSKRFVRMYRKRRIAILIVYADDIILIGDDVEEMERSKKCLAPEFEIKDLGSFLAWKWLKQRRELWSNIYIYMYGNTN